jgi:hypothetical protein
MHVGIIFIFQVNLESSYVCVPACFMNVTSSTLMWNIVNRLIHLFGSLTGSVVISVPQSVCLALKIVLALNQFPLFKFLRATYGIMTVLWYVACEE